MAYGIYLYWTCTEEYSSQYLKTQCDFASISWGSFVYYVPNECQQVKVRILNIYFIIFVVDFTVALGAL